MNLICKHHDRKSLMHTPKLFRWTAKSLRSASSHCACKHIQAGAGSRACFKHICIACIDVDDIFVDDENDFLRGCCNNRECGSIIITVQHHFPCSGRKRWCIQYTNYAPFSHWLVLCRVRRPYPPRLLSWAGQPIHFRTQHSQRPQTHHFRTLLYGQTSELIFTT